MTFKVGDRVRILWTPLLGQIGTIVVKCDNSAYIDLEHDFQRVHLLDVSLELVTPPKPETWIVSAEGSMYADFFSNKEGADVRAKFLANTHKNHKIYISKAVGYVESVPQPTTRYVEL